MMPRQILFWSILFPLVFANSKIADSQIRNKRFEDQKWHKEYVKARKEALKIAGTWQAVEGKWQGKVLNPGHFKQCRLWIQAPPKDPSAQFGGGTGPSFTLQFPKKTVDFVWVTDNGPETRYYKSLSKYGFSLNSKKNPNQISIYKQFGAKLLSYNGVYKLNKDTLTLRLDLDRFAKFPKNFESPRNSKAFLVTMKRVQRP